MDDREIDGQVDRQIFIWLAFKIYIFFVLEHKQLTNSIMIVSGEQ